MKTEFEKGDVVLVAATVKSTVNWMGSSCEVAFRPEKTKGAHPGDVRILLRCPEKFRGLVVGVSVRKTGVRRDPSGYDRFAERYLADEVRHPVVMVEPLWTKRWLEPRACLAEDLELVTEETANGD